MRRQNCLMQEDRDSVAGGGASSLWGRFGRGIACVPAWARRAYGISALVLAGIIAVNINTVIHDAVARYGLPAWKVVTWEASSGAVFLVCAPLPLLALWCAPPGRGRWPRFLGVHAAASLVFSVMHVAGMIGLRTLVYRHMGESYSFGDALSEFLYEYRKDMAAYALIVAIGWVSLRLDRAGAAQEQLLVPGAAPAAADDLLEIRDGSRLVVARLDEIVCAHAEGNYVAFILADGRKPLMRTTLTAMEQRLADGAGLMQAEASSGDRFVRTHRSWLVNLRHVRESEPTGTGDFMMRMTDGSAVPLSRRYGAAVQLIRKRPAA